MNRITQLIRTTSLVLLLLPLVSVVSADNMEKETGSESDSLFKNFKLYRTPSSATPSASDRAKNCYALENEISALVPQTYSYKPDFYNDPYQGASVWIGTTLFMPAYAISVYSGIQQYGENTRIVSAEERIDLLRRLKAQNRCFES
ncbi:MAG: hypothetical protein OQK42_02075 [Sedimenticola sp.]|uniref:Uncharacterized protein n=1 Tax=Sedimenticola thiotaurini TaxID=1543721 RepID=A0A558CY69_9GAMM|nr:hypothetical protein [Sedimenticola sp.]TVT53704.1 MAG: hypothetical protein FHK82_11490 [Sedimenticola thiotaurini]MCW8880798.1 hypothetical protein [Sedimenticola sp.]MCW8920330.1 hypothetical protein [Sedimenticola sp.]MCW8974721.1 hypothetical protein [Sedimenticola sp.]